MSKRVLVAYASKYGATAEIAEKIGIELESAGLNVSVEDAGKVKDLADAAFVILGSAIYYGRWRKGATKFLKKFEKQLAGIPVWFFSSGPIGEGAPEDLLDGWRFPPNQQELADRVQPRDVVVFHGKLDEAKLSRLEKKIMETMETPAGDFRDWAIIKDWVQGITSAIERES